MEPGMNRDFVEMLSALSETKAEFLMVGTYALAVHRYLLTELVSHPEP